MCTGIRLSVVLGFCVLVVLNVQVLLVFFHLSFFVFYPCFYSMFLVVFIHILIFYINFLHWF